MSQPERPTPEPSRPYMPYGLENVTSPPGERLPWSRVSELLTASRYYWLCTVRPDRRPHAMPVWGLWLDDTFYFSIWRESRKERNLASNPEVIVHLESGEEAVILEGTAEEVTDPSFLTRFADVYEAKYHWRPELDLPEGHPGRAPWLEFFRLCPVYAMRSRVAFSFREEQFGETATRWRFRAG